ncbi:hypothetical protein [Frankia sp. Cr2]|uniref:hypothetical protein n=1 Tax=Frankia sp. Cr2 TaxID=3073932 RepID=UPI002AD49B85|nr:hypothetical protein [Frankia sp. Cr2]
MIVIGMIVIATIVTGAVVGAICSDIRRHGRSPQLGAGSLGAGSLGAGSLSA